MSIWSRYDLSYQSAVQKSFHAIFVVLEVSVAHVTYRATVTATLHIGPHECKNRLTVSIWSRYDILPQSAVQKSFHANFVVLEVSAMHVVYRATVIATLHIGPHECKNRQCQFGQDMRYLTTVCSLEKFPCKFDRL